MTMTRILRAIAVVLVIAVAAPAVAAVSDEDIDRARQEVNRIVEKSQELGDDVQAAWARQAELEDEISNLQSSIEFARARLADLETQLEDVAVELYMGSTSGISLSFLFNAGDNEISAGLEYLREVSGVNNDVLNQLKTFKQELGRQTDRLSDASAEQDLVTADLEEKAVDLQGRLIEAQAVYDDLVSQQAREEERRRAEEERRRQEERRKRAAEAARQATSTTTTTSAVGGGATATTVAEETTTTATSTTTTVAPSSSGNGACPVAGAVYFSDSWGAPRSGGRHHEGVDMMAARGTPVVAPFEGTIKRISTGNLGGKSLWLRVSNGDEFYFAHLDAYGDITVGGHVAEAFVLGYVGSTGNAPDWLPHLHFEYHPGGFSAVNPYPLARSLCG